MFGRKNSSASHNSGVTVGSGGAIGGDVQNQPGAVGSHISKVTVVSPQATEDWSARLNRIRTALDEEQQSVREYEQCRMLLDLAGQQRLDDPGGRGSAETMLSQVLDRCGGAPGVASLVSSALSFIATLAG
ncbi:hypothetical protein [Streptomyces endophyticus]|uniref:Uncharacterized protein n=1 Tax=Streptomyces endophyticus TaxID=714166 RepID=A0ABU6F611_9ACTN|nr:hypothetical protein [Streptomyces endophyticus]MEB8339434.1 hypothetical protein [Streptomyces endophyticus]